MPITRVKLGKDAAIYVSSDYTGTVSSATWEELTTVTNVQVKSEKDQTEVSARKHGGKKVMENTLHDRGVTFDINTFAGDEVAHNLEAAHEADTVLHFLVLDAKKTVVGARGFVFPGQVKNWPQEQPLSGHITGSVEITQADSAYMGGRHTVTS